MSVKSEMRNTILQVQQNLCLKKSSKIGPISSLLFELYVRFIHVMISLKSSIITWKEQFFRKT